MAAEKNDGGAVNAPEPCLSGRCWSPYACDGWGYCRERNDGHLPTADELERFRKQAIAERKAKE